ncbi:MAG: DNA-processing protein DprA [Candidatus Sulfobium sp.]|jgi:DNA processing protein
MSEARYWIGLSLVPDVGPVTSRKLLAVMGTPENIFRAGTKDLLSLKGFRKETADNIRNFRFWDEVERYERETRKKGIRVVGLDDPLYPAPLKEIEGAPVVLYMTGEYQPDDRFGIAVVGSRKYTYYGESVTQKIAGELSAAGFTIVSGLARGVDTLSHKSALASGGRTIAVLGSGSDICYPSENRGLMEKIASSGCVISEFPPGTAPNRENFPRRNRLISGLALGVLVVEAAPESGSLITANYALEQNKEVFAVPGNITSPNSEGTNRLIRQGAKLVMKAGDVIEELAPVLKGFITARKEESVELSEEERSLCRALSREPRHIDTVTREVSLPAHKTLEVMLSLELKGVVRQSGGKRFYLA